MAIRFQFGGVTYTADTAEEAAETTRLLRLRALGEEILSRFQGLSEEDLKAAVRQSGSDERMTRTERRLSAKDEGAFAWTADYFQSVIDRLAEPQKRGLALLVTKRRLTDAELRTALNVSNNQRWLESCSGYLSKPQQSTFPLGPSFALKNS